jgi:uncharacterized repeat protein (TIGR01451 family)
VSIPDCTEAPEIERVQPRRKSGKTMHLSPVTPPDRSSRAGAWFARLAAVLALALGMGALSAPAAFAADGALTITKTVDGQESVTVDPGDEFSYLVTVGCDDGDCVDAQLVDVLPAEFAGFDIVSSSVNPPTPPTSTSFVGCTTVVTTSCSVTVDFETALDGGATGIRAGDTQALMLTLRAPLTLSPGWASNGEPVTNTAVATSSTAPSVGDSAVVTVAIPITVDLAVGKTWSPATQQFSPGVQSTVELTARNTSNVVAETLVLQDPKTAAAAAATLDPSNPFAIVDFVGFGPVVAPQGADRVTVDAYVLSGGTWGWMAGTPSPVAAISPPTGVQPADVGGLRFTFSSTSGATIAASGAAGSVRFTVAQRAENRTTGASLVLGSTATNQVTGTVTVAGQPPVSRDASAPYRIAGLTVDVTAGKTITPGRIPAGTTATAVITGKNDSNGPLTSLTLGDTAFFNADVGFGGFTAPIAYPAGATGASIEWSYSDGSTVGPVAVAAGGTPIAPVAPGSEHLTGFAVTYVGAIAAASVASLTFAIAPSVDVVPTMAASPVTVQNTARVSGTNPAGTDTAQAVAPLAVFFPDIDLRIDKTIAPTGAVNPGGTVVVQLPTTTGTDSAFVKPTRVVIEDVWRSGDADDFWAAFNPVAIAPTQVIAGSSLAVEYTTDGTNWVVYDTVPATASTVVYSESIGGVDTSTITGLRYTFENSAGLAQGTTVSPNTVFSARSILRGTSTPTSVADAPASVYENRGSAVGTGAVLGGTTITSDEVADVATARIVSSTGAGSTLVAKDWTAASVVSQSGGAATTNLGWGVTATGAADVTITDPASGAETTPAATAFQAFDLTRIRPVSFTQDPLLRWDRVTSVQLHSTAAGAWVPAAAAGTVWMNATGFIGYTLTAAQSADTTGVRLVVQPNDPARAASSNPLAPAVGSGVASSTAASPRPLVLDWSLRNVARVGGAWIGETGFASVANTVGVTVGGVESTDSDSIALVDFEPAVAVTKKASTTGLTIPELGDVAPADYPRVDFTITAENESASRASYVRVTDPMPCTESTVASCVTAPGDWAADPYAGAVYDPALNPFERLDLQKLTFTVPTSQVDKAASRVTLWQRDASGTLSRSVVTVTAAEALTPAQLADVVGVSVVYQGTDPATRGGSIVSGADLVMVMSTRLRVFERSDAAQLVTPTTVDNHTDAQSYDPVLFPSGVGSTPHDSAFAEVPLLTGRLDATATKQVAPDSLLQRDRATPVTVTLGATDGTATAAATTVTVADTDADFWNTFRLTGLGAVSLPAGADRVRVDVQLDGDPAWTTGVAAPAAVLPPVAPERITGIRLVFERADGALLSRTSPPGDWTAGAALTVVLRDVLRDSGDPVVFPSTIENEVTVTSSRTDAVFSPVTARAADTIALATGTWALDVAKSPAGNTHTVFPGVVVPWTLEFRNSGTGYLSLTDLVDQLPSHLTFDFEQPVYTTTAGGSLSTDVTYSYDEPTKRITFAWPDDGDLMAPGERFTITLGLTLEPGLLVSDRATNQFVVTTGQPLAACTNTSGNGQGTLAGVGATQCGTTNFVQPTPGASLATYKGVKGDIDTALASGAVNTANPSAPCVLDAEGYYRAPCAANTAVGSTDEWKLLAVNSGTENYRSLTMVDPLPRLGDRMLATGGSRASTYQPVFDGAFGVVASGAPAGSTIVWQVTTDDAPCVGSGATAWNTDPTCAANTWTPGAAYTGDWAAVTALRVTVDFTTSAAGVLAPAGSFKVVYQSVNAPATAAFPGGAPLDAPATAQFAWNQFGARAVLDGGATLQRAPVKVGVRLAESALAVTKAITGDAAAYAPGTFRVDVACSVVGQPVALGPDGVLELTSANGLTDRIDHLPLGASCAVAEQGAVGEFGESSRTGTPATIPLLQPVDTVTPVVASQVATVGNVYDVSGLSVTKRIDTLATVGDFGRFEFTLDCVTSLGTPVTLDASDATFSLRGGETHTVTAGTLPVGAECALAETGAGDATATAITGAGVADAGDGTATITVGATASVATVSNRFEAGTLSVVKTVTGAGAAGYGTGPFAASVDCTYRGARVYSERELALVAGVPVQVGAVLPVGTVCSVVELVTGGATSHDDPPAVTISGPAGSAAVGAVTVDVTNHFDVGSLALVKERVGEGVAAFGGGPFEVAVVCTWLRDGAVLTVPLPDGGVFTLDEASGYAVTVPGIVVGAECAVEETDAGMATATALEPADGRVTILDPAVATRPATVTITNTFDVGRLELGKTADSAIAAVGGLVTYTLTARNTGDIAAHGVTVVDELPAGAQVISAAPAATTATGDTLAWEQPELGVGETATFTVTLRFDTTGSHVNRASIVMPEGPWEAPTVLNECAGDADEACAAVAVASLALTGSELPLTLLAFAAAALVTGLGLFGRSRRRARP